MTVLLQEVVSVTKISITEWPQQRSVEAQCVRGNAALALQLFDCQNNNQCLNSTALKFELRYFKVVQNQYTIAKLLMNLLNTLKQHSVALKGLKAKI